MGLPDVNITFTEAANTVLVRAQKGIVAIILKDAAADVQGSHVLKDVSDIPSELSEVNRNYIKQAFVGAENKPSRVLAYVLPDTAENLSEATKWLSAQNFNWLVGPPDCDSTEATELKAWIVAQRTAGRFYKAVLPETVANNKAIVNFTTDGIVMDGNTYTAAGYCARIAGLIAGTPLNSSITYAVLPEVTAVEQLTRAEMDTAIDDGWLILLHDGKKVKAGRGVTSLTTPATGESTAYKKIKIVEAADLICEDLRTITEDVYIGKYANSYDNKLLLVSAYKDYFKNLENEGVLKAGSTVSLDTVAIAAWLKEHGKDVADMSEADIKQADTGDKVFIKACILILDAIEDVSLQIAF